MRHRAFSLLTLVILSGLTSRLNAEVQMPSLVFIHVTVIDATGAPPQQDMTITIRGDRIVEIGKSNAVRLPDNARVIDATGKYLIPGLWDMHVHLSIVTELALPALIANGVTGVRDLGGDLREIDHWRGEIESRRLVGPRIFRAGPLVDGPKKGASYRLTVTSPAEARRAVLSLKQDGVDFIKVHNRVPREAYFALAEECRKRQLTYVGHIPRGISAEEASDAGQRSIEHTETLVEAAVFQPNSSAKTPEDGLAAYTPQRRKLLFAKFVRNNTWYCPTLVGYRGFAHEGNPSVAHDPRQKYLAPAAKEYIDRYWPLPPKGAPPEDHSGRKTIFRGLLGIVGDMQRAGVGILAGTDPPARSVIPGFSIHEELELLVEAGLTPLEALQSATRNPARFLGKPNELGTVERGKIADLVLLEADPLKNIKNTRRIAALVLAGRLFEKPELQEMLSKVESAVKGK